MRTAVSLAGLATFLACPVSLHALEPWADQTLPIQAGLELWLDASRENAARSASVPGRQPELARVPNNGPLDVWHDASGKKRNLTQFAIEARPRLVQGINSATVHFDGKDDFLMAATGAVELPEFTLFLQTKPRSNPGGFRAFMGTSRPGRNDYTTGLNADLGFAGGSRFQTFNVEGAGASGFRNLLKADLEFNQMHLLTIVSSGSAQRIKLWANGLPQGERERTSAAAAAELLTVGARFYSNTGEPPHVQGFFDGDISQVLVYSRVLSDQERAAVEHHLRSKIFARELPGRRLAALESVTNPPPIRMFVPGFTWQQLPVKLNNINGVKYRDDGKLVALGYDGRIWLLSDTNGDGTEDRADAFWSSNTLRAPVGMALTPPNYWRGRGVFVPSKGKVSLIVDTNRDDVADEEVIVAEGWKELPHGVDALGAALDGAGNLYFGLGAANFTEPYLVDGKTGRAGYSLNSERGTILKVSPDFSKREIFCTGIRFPVALAFNRQGDLFGTDQEGATWLPNGNPLDELLLLERGRHYGFPPRHPQHLPDVIDEPSVFDYAPQHQSSCGLNFNEPINGGPVFGPASWRGDALVTGYSRGKLYRTGLVKTEFGYVARNQLIGSVNGLPADGCVSPQGDLVIAVHSGSPDWGSGPSGAGTLYRISYSRKERAEPVAIWPANSTETWIEFDRPLKADELKQWQKRVVITEGRSAAAGDRFENNRPGYQVVANQLAEPRFELEVHSLALAADGKILAVRTARRDVAQNYAVSLPATQAAERSEPGDEHTVELAYDLTGVVAIWQGEQPSSSVIETWLPHLDLSVAKQFTQGIANCEPFWAAATGPGTLTLRAQLDLWQMLKPAVQPGSRLDYAYPAEQVTVGLQSNGKLEVNAAEATIQRLGDANVRLQFRSDTNRWFPVEIRMRCATAEAPQLTASWFTADDPRPRAFPLRRILLPWASPPEIESTFKPPRAELAGGNWLRGREVFFGEQAACGRCHTVRGQGGQAGPDLSNLPHRDYASVLKDIRQPSAALNPDHLSYQIELKQGAESPSGVITGGNEQEILLADASGRAIAIERENIRSLKPSSISLMPEGLWEGLPETHRRDLMTFLLSPEPLEPAPIEIPGAPEPRSFSELDNVLKKADGLTARSNSTLSVVLCAGPKDHGPGEHDYPLWQKRWQTLLGLSDRVAVETAWQWPSPAQFQRADVVVFYSNNPGWSTNRARELDTFLERGRGLVYIHYAVDGHADCEALADRIGLAWRGGASLFRHGPLDLQIKNHPITRNFARLHLVDESYWNLIGNEQRIEVLAEGIEGDRRRPLVWVREQGPGRVFVSIPGHYNWTFDDPLFRTLLLRGIAWTARQPIDRFDELTAIGARVAPEKPPLQK